MKHFDQFDVEDIQRIAIIRRNNLGDLMSSLPLVNYCKKNFPKAKITLISDTSNSMLFPYLENIDEVIVIEKGNKYLKSLKAALKARKAKFDLAIAARPNAMKLNHLLLYFAKAKHRIAVTEPDKWHNKFVNCQTPRDLITGNHQALQILQILNSSLQEVECELYPKLKMLTASRPRCDNLCRLLVTVSQSRARNRISVDKHVSLLNRLYDQVAFKTIILSMEKDAALAHELAKKLKCTSEVAVTPEFGRFMETVANADCVFSGDGGLCHIAAGYNKPQCVLFGRDVDKQWAPLSSKAVSLMHPDDVNAISDDDIFPLLLSTLKKGQNA
ncbi:MAG: glycosyltransferase family 9 protein [Parachlamydiales bacterium]|nr:glycosyltransferase family 9 protein [Parachlamydiales bacterium]